MATSAPPSKGVLTLIASPLAETGWRIGGGLFTDDPDQQVVVVDTPGQESNPKWLLDYVHFQILVRGAKQGGYESAYAKAQKAFDILLGIPPQTVLGDRWDGITSMGGRPSLIGQDVNARPLISANFRIIIEPAASAETNREPL